MCAENLRYRKLICTELTLNVLIVKLCFAPSPSHKHRLDRIHAANRPTYSRRARLRQDSRRHRTRRVSSMLPPRLELMLGIFYSYPAGFIYVYSLLHWLTHHGKDIRTAQYIFAFLYVATMTVVFRLYRYSRQVRHFRVPLSVI